MWRAAAPDMGKWACRGSQRSARPVQRQPTVKVVMPSRLDPPDMLRLDVLDEEFGDAAAHARRRRIGERLLMLAIVALGLGAIGALAFAWSNADGPLRFELQSAAIARKSGQRAAAQAEIGTRTRRRWTWPSPTNRNGPASRRRPAARRPRAPNRAVCASARALRQHRRRLRGNHPRRRCHFRAMAPWSKVEATLHEPPQPVERINGPGLITNTRSTYAARRKRSARSIP